ncbi:MAG: addiction module toxin RelE [Bacteroidales bacterium]|nr:addiction module toxin RelE [Bacteroidales bacterium]
MNRIKEVSVEFKDNAKKLKKKYKSFVDDMKAFEQELLENPYLGASLGHGMRKVRMQISSKGKGKSGGARVITMVVNVLESEDNDIDISLLYIYDKNEMDNVSDSFLKYLADTYAA